MITQLILSTLMACQPKDTPPALPNETQPPEETQPPNETQPPEETITKPDFDNTPATKPPPETAPQNPIIIAETVPTPKESDPENNFFSGPVLLSHIPYPNQLSEDVFCEVICKKVHQKGSKVLMSVRNCQIDLIATWEEYRKDFSIKDRQQTGNPAVGAVSCNASMGYLKRGRGGLCATHTSPNDQKWSGYLARAAQEEGTAVYAFQEFLAHLKKWNAPKHLQETC